MSALPSQRGAGSSSEESTGVGTGAVDSGVVDDGGGCVEAAPPGV